MLKGLDPVTRSTLSEQVAKRLAARIASGDWRPGDKLPSEAKLCKALDVGRSSLREALTSLAFIGLIRVLAGGGSYVAEHPSAYFTSPWLNNGKLTNEKSLGEFVEARLILETELAGLCAERVTVKELDHIGRLVGQMKASTHNAEEFSKLDLSFHLSMGCAAKNEVLNKILSSVREQTMELIIKSHLLEEGMGNALRDHIKILATFQERNPSKAREAMRHHLQSFQRGYKVIFETSPKTPVLVSAVFPKSKGRISKPQPSAKVSMKAAAVRKNSAN